MSTGATAKLVSGIADDLGSVAVSAGRVYFATYNAIYYVPLPNGASKPTKFADTLVRNLVADERGVYWTADSQGAVLRCPHSGCDSPETIAAGQTNPGPMTQDSVSIYWASIGGTNAIRRLAKDLELTASASLAVGRVGGDALGGRLHEGRELATCEISERAHRRARSLVH